ncbi:MAG: hypothetical protein MUF49_16720 [Oculatellaceae cyanobacterium Prado106]|nr:hypothetical protein [Oculatellaceae cyanobacterium Prado106]
MSELKLVLDSNVLVSAALFKRSVARQALNKAMADGQRNGMWRLRGHTP